MRPWSRYGWLTEPSLDNVPEIAKRYFELDAEGDVDGIVALFGEDAIVIDEGEARDGLDAIRGWRTGAASEYEYTTTVTGSEALGEGRYRVTARLEGNFPGGTVDLNHDFTLAGDRIRRLVIAP
jgi:hypothetical protein